MQRTGFVRSRRLALSLSSLAAFFLAGGPAGAQVAPLIPGTATLGPEATVPERTSVGQRVEPEYAAIGGQIGDFLFFPTLDLQELYNSNVFVTETDKKSDFATFISPALSVASNWNSNALNFLVSDQTRRYVSQVSENESNVSVATNGRLDILRNVYLTGALGYQLAHEDRTSPNTVIGQKFPTEYQLASARLGYVHDVGILGFRLDGGVDDYSYNNNSLASGATVIETDRNRVEYGLTPRVTYEIVPGYHAFIQVPVNVREYQAKFDQFGLQRSSHGYEFDAGTAFEVTSLVNGELYVGYLEQDYDDARLPAAQGPAFGANLLWNPTTLTSVRLNAARTVEETTLGGVAPLVAVSSFIQSTVGASIEHSLLRNVLLTGGMSYTDQNYQGISRDDVIYAANAGGRYLLNQYLSATLTANYQTRQSNVAPNSYHQETILAGLRLQY